jgi:hypothetical protein
MRKKSLILATALIGTLALPPKAEAKDACKTLICMAGKPGIGNGSISGGCQGAVSDFFNIRVFGMWGYQPGRTAAKRGLFLHECPGALVNEETIMKIISIYGTLMFDPT